ncbi:MAG: alpha/beta hydrolase [Microcystaceae cyanobacterium]
MKLNSRFARLLSPLVLAGMSAFLTHLPVKAAERIFLTYGPLKQSIRVESLERFATEGVVDPNLRFYFNLVGVSPQQQQELRTLLTKRAEINPVQLSRFLNSDMGEDLLSRLGRLATIPGGRNGMFALRGALISAALDKDGLTAMNFIQQLPTNIQLQGELILQRVNVISIVVEATEQFVGTIGQLSQAEAKTEPNVNFSQLPDPRQPGPYGVAPKEVWQLVDSSRDRRFYVDVFKPQRWRAGQTPVLVMSHGLGSRPEDFSSVGEQLASYGFVVALPQHPGSDFQQAQNLLNGLSRQVFKTNEFIDRPKDISFVLDELERRNAQEFGNRLNLKAVGVAGHSFGGYGALAVGGAEINWRYLKSECDPERGFPNTSLLLQCRALDLPRTSLQFRDPRVAAVVAINPVISAIFGPSGLEAMKVPVIIAGGSYDPATPFVLEQVRTFPWLGSQQKYFALAEGQAHVDFSQLDAGMTHTIKSLGDLTLPSPDLLHSYRNGLMVPFFQVYVAQDQSYQPFMTAIAQYSQYLSQGQEFKLFVISEASVPPLVEALEDFARRHNLPVPQP